MTTYQVETNNGTILGSDYESVEQAISQINENGWRGEFMVVAIADNGDADFVTGYAQ